MRTPGFRKMAGGLGSSVNDASWELTSYLVANAVVLPFSGWLSILLGRKRCYMASVVAFTLQAPRLPASRDLLSSEISVPVVAAQMHRYSGGEHRA